MQLRKSTRMALSYLQQKLGKSSLLSFFPVTNEIEENGTCAPIPSTSYLSNLKSFLIALELLCLITDNSVHQKWVIIRCYSSSSNISYLNPREAADFGMDPASIRGPQFPKEGNHYYKGFFLP